ncbi:twin-arginine translocase TatA/TatE family subunit [Patescibacteria group bacterium]|nr:MAG: twin-arginine translocase TatA/TatE family subunit [Patescibacteria group bacterium]
MGKVEIIAIIVLAIVLLFVGGKKLPEFARGLGKTRSEFKKAMNGEYDDKDEVAEKTVKKTTKKS